MEKYKEKVLCANACVYVILVGYECPIIWSSNQKVTRSNSQTRNAYNSFATMIVITIIANQIADVLIGSEMQSTLFYWVMRLSTTSNQPTKMEKNPKRLPWCNSTKNRVYTSKTLLCLPQSYIHTHIHAHKIYKKEPKNFKRGNPHQNSFRGSKVSIVLFIYLFFSSVC